MKYSVFHFAGVAMISFIAAGSNAAAQTYYWKDIGGNGTTPGTSEAPFKGVLSMAYHSSGLLYFTDLGRLRTISPAGVITTVAGSLTQGGEDGVGASAQLRAPGAIAFHNQLLWIADTSNSLIRTFSLQSHGVNTEAGVERVVGTTDGPATSAKFNYPDGIAVDNAGVVYIADTMNHSIRRLKLDGTVDTFAGSSGNAGYANGTGTAARFNRPSGICYDGSANFYVADAGNHAIRKITSAGVVTTIAGDPNSGDFDNDGTGSNAHFRAPYDIATDGLGNCFVTDSVNVNIRKVTWTGVVTSLTSSGYLPPYYSADGLGLAARFIDVRAIAAGPVGTLWASETTKIRSGVAPNPQIIYNPEIGAVTLYFHAAAQADYDLQRSSLTNGLNGWSTIGSFFTGADGAVNYTDPAPATPRKSAFYRLKPAQVVGGGP